jgi:hypothetical protein
MTFLLYSSLVSDDVIKHSGMFLLNNLSDLGIRSAVTVTIDFEPTAGPFRCGCFPV